MTDDDMHEDGPDELGSHGDEGADVAWTSEAIGAEGEDIVTRWARLARVQMAKLSPDGLGIDRVFELPSDTRPPAGVGMVPGVN